MCQAAGEWQLVGVAAWRRGCSGAASIRRPRLYDKVAVNSEWAARTMDAMDSQANGKAKKKRRVVRRKGS